MTTAEAASAEKISDAQGVVLFENLEWGTSYIKETTVPDGYLPDTISESPVVIDQLNNGTTVEVSATHTPKLGSIDPTKTGLLINDIALFVITAFNDYNETFTLSQTNTQWLNNNLSFGTYN